MKRATLAFGLNQLNRLISWLRRLDLARTPRQPGSYKSRNYFNFMPLYWNPRKIPISIVLAGVIAF